MRPLVRTCGSAVALLLAGCGSKPAPPSPQAIDHAVAHARVEAKVAEKIRQAAPAPPPVPAAAPIPAAFQGRWGLVAADCKAGFDQAKGSLTIAGNALRFDGSGMQLTKRLDSSPETLEAEFASSGDGAGRTRAETLALAGSGNILLRTEHGRTSRYTRCRTRQVR